MVKYAKCPRCELNYIDIEKMQFCEICQKEMKGLIDDDPLFDEDGEEEMELCPICGENMMRMGEKMCDECKSKSEYEDDVEPDIDENDDEWRNYLDDDAGDSEVIDIGVGNDDFDDEEEEEEMEGNDGFDDDDFDYPSDNYHYTGDDDFDDDDDDDDDFDDDDDDDDFDDDDDDDDDFSAPAKRGRRKKNDDDF